MSTAAAAPAVAFHDVTVHRGGRAVLRDINLGIHRGRMTAIVGPNGAGKSTLLSAALGLLPLSQGRVEVEGDASGARGRRIAWVPQRSSVDWDFPLTVRDVVMQGRWPALRWWQRAGAKDNALVEAALREVDLLPLARRRIGDLSGGQQQRAMVARALVRQADVLFLDEPFAGLDAPNERQLLGILRRQAAEGRAVVVVHHDLATVRSHFDEVVLLSGTVLAQGAPDDVLQPHALLRAYGVQLPTPGDLPVAVSGVSLPISSPASEHAE